MTFQILAVNLKLSGLYLLLTFCMKLPNFKDGLNKFQINMSESSRLDLPVGNMSNHQGMRKRGITGSPLESDRNVILLEHPLFG